MHGDNGECQEEPRPGLGPGPAGPGRGPGSRIAETAWADALPDVVAAVLWGVWSFVVFSSTISLFWFDAGSLGYYLCFEAVILTSLVMSWLPGVERDIARRLHRLQHPSTVEAQRLHAAWTAVERRAGPRLICHPNTRQVGIGKFRITMHPCRIEYRLWVVDAGPVPTTPASTVGYPIAVTRWAVHSLPPAQLEAVLAHQVGYLLVADWRRALAGLMLWYSLPARGFVIIGRRIGPVLRRVPLLGCLVVGVIGSGILTVIITSALFGDLSATVAWLLLIASPLWAPPLLDLFERHRERRADRIAADLGYGPALLEVLYTWQQRDIEHSQPGQRPTATHRIAALEHRISGQTQT